MQIQKGLVKYKDRTDIVCTYGLTEDGKQYYFLDDNSIPNGNIIASTALVEAIDPVVVASSVGVIDSKGNVIIPFENRTIKPIAQGLLLVESANPTTPSVLEAIKLRSDPLSATKLVTTPATIKDNMNARMGNGGRFVFNDQFSEATIYDADGNNLINNEYYSFIGLKNNETLFFSKNTVDSEVKEFSLTSREFIRSSSSNEENGSLDVKNTAITQDVIDNVMTGPSSLDSSFGSDDITAADFEDMSVSGDDSQIMVDNTIPPEAMSSVDVNNEAEVVSESQGEVKEYNGFNPAEVANDVTNTFNVNSSELVDSNDATISSVDEVRESDSADVADNSDALKENQGSNENFEEEATVDLSESKVIPENNTMMEFNFGDNINYSGISLGDGVNKSDDEEVVANDFKNNLFDMDLDSDIFAESTLQADQISLDSYVDSNVRVGSKDTIIEDVASTLANLISLNKTQKEKIVSYEEKFEQMSVAHKKLVDRAKTQIRDIELLKGKINNYENIVDRLESKIQSLESKVRDQDRLISSQKSELESLRPQIEGKKELARILADAQTLLEQES